MRSTCGATALRVAVLAPISWRTPHRHYGPWEQFASLLTEGLVERGVDVTLFATSDSVTTARLVGGRPARVLGGSGRRTQGLGVPAHSRGVRAGRRVRYYPQQLRLSSPSPIPRASSPPRLSLLSTGSPPHSILPVFREKYNHADQLRRYQRRGPPSRTGYLATIHHGIDTGHVHPANLPRKLLAFLRSDPPGQRGGRGHSRCRPCRATARYGWHYPGPVVLRRCYRTPPQWQARPLRRASGGRGSQCPPRRGFSPSSTSSTSRNRSASASSKPWPAGRQ